MITPIDFAQSLRIKRARRQARQRFLSGIALAAIICAVLFIIVALTTGCDTAPIDVCARITFRQTTADPLFDAYIGRNLIMRDLTVGQIREMCGAK